MGECRGFVGLPWREGAYGRGIGDWNVGEVRGEACWDGVESRGAS